MFFSVGVNSDSARRSLVVQVPEEQEDVPAALNDPPSQALHHLSPVSHGSSSPSSESRTRSSSPVVRSEQIRPGRWTHVSHRISVRPLTNAEAEAALERQRQREERRRLRREKREAEVAKADSVDSETAENHCSTSYSESTSSSKGRARMDDPDETRSSVDTGGLVDIPPATAVPGAGGAAGAPPIPESPGSRSNYGEFYWDRYGHLVDDDKDTNGENSYHHNSSFDDDILLDLEGRIGAARLDRTQDDLNKFRQRIDNNVEQQREYSEMMAALQNKVLEYRRHIADLEGRMLGQRPVSVVDPSTIMVFDDHSYLRDMDLWSPSRRNGGGGGNGTNIDIKLGGGFGGGFSGGAAPAYGPGGTNVLLGGGDRGLSSMYGITAGDPNANYEAIARIEDERRRADEYRMQYENERARNEELVHENDRLRREFERYEREMRDKERGYINREKNLSQYLSDEQKKMMDLWTELQRVRKQFNELKHQTEEDLENQRSEFTRTLRNVTSLTRNINLLPSDALRAAATADGVGSGNIGALLAELAASGGAGPGGIDTTMILETLRRIGRGGTSVNVNVDNKELLDELRLIRGSATSTDDAEINRDLMKKYEESIERNIELESRGDDHMRKIAECEAELRRAKEKLAETTNALRKLHDIAHDSDRSPDGSGKRTRSLSPGKAPLPPSEAVRAVRSVLRNKDNDIQQLERRIKISEAQAKDFIAKFESADEQRRRLDKQFFDAKREIAAQQKSFDDLERNVRRLDDKLRASESERLAAEKARHLLEEEIAKLHKQFQQASEEDARKAREAADEHTSTLEDDYKARVDELQRRIESLQSENAKLKADLTPLKDKLRDLENEHNNMQRRLDDKEAQIKYHEEVKRQIQKTLDELRTANDILTAEHDKALSDLEIALKQASLAEHQIKEVKAQRDDFQKQKDVLSRQIFDIKHSMEILKKERDDVEKAGQQNNEEIEKLKENVIDYERQINLLRRHNDDQDTTIKNGLAKITQIENDLYSRTKEVEKLNDLNEHLQKEKQDVLSQKHQAETETANLKEVIRKLEQEAEKLRALVKELTEKESAAHNGQTAQAARASQLAKELEDIRRDRAAISEHASALEKEVADLKAAVNELRDKLRRSGTQAILNGKGGVNINIDDGRGGVGSRAGDGGGSGGAVGRRPGSAGKFAYGGGSDGRGDVNINIHGGGGSDGTGGTGQGGKGIGGDAWSGGGFDPYATGYGGYGGNADGSGGAGEGDGPGVQRRGGGRGPDDEFGGEGSGGNGDGTTGRDSSRDVVVGGSLRYGGPDAGGVHDGEYGDEVDIPGGVRDGAGGDGRDGRHGHDGRPGEGITDRILREISDNSDKYKDDELTAMRIREINDKWKLEFEKLENDRDDLERRIRDLEDELSRVGRGSERADSDISELKSKYESEIEKLKAEIAGLNDKHMGDLDDEREQYNQGAAALKAIEDELREKVSNLEKQLADSLSRQQELEQEKADSDDKIDSLFAQNQKYKDDIETLRQDTDTEIQKWKTDAYTARSEAKALETANAGLKAQLQTANDRIETLTKTVSDHTSKIRELTTQVRRLEEDLADTKSALLHKEGDLDNTQSRLRTIEDQYAALQTDSNKMRLELEAAFRENDMLKNAHSNSETEMSRLKNKLKASEDTLRELKNSFSHLKADREKLHNAYRDKAKQADHLNQLSQQFDIKMQKMRNELNEATDKLSNADLERTELRNRINKITTELKFGEDQMNRKNDEYESTLNDLANAHRASEDGRLNAIQELETKKYELNDLASRLDNTEQRLIALQQDYIRADSERDSLADALRRFQLSANRLMSLNNVAGLFGGGLADGAAGGAVGPAGMGYGYLPGGHPGSTNINITGGFGPGAGAGAYGQGGGAGRDGGPGSGVDDGGAALRGGLPMPVDQGGVIGEGDGTGGATNIDIDLGGGTGMPEGYQSGYGGYGDPTIGGADAADSGGQRGGENGFGAGGIPRSVPFPPVPDFCYGGGRERAGGSGGGTASQVNINEHIDVSQLEGTLQQLLDKIARLEVERNELRDALNRLRKKTSDSQTSNNKHEIRFKTIEDNLNDVEEDKRALEARLASAKQLLRSQEEALKQRDDERRQMKTKMVAAELQARGKEAQLRTLTEQLKNLRADLDNAHTEIRQLRDREESWDASRFHLESQVRENDAEKHKIIIQINQYESERTGHLEKLKELESQLRLIEQKYSDKSDDYDRVKRELAKAGSYELEVRKTTELYNKVNGELQGYKDQITALNNDVTTANSRKQQLETELLNLRAELRDAKQRAHDVASRVSELQRQLQDAHAEKNRLEDRILNLDKTIATNRTNEGELRQQLDTSKNERREMQKEIDELKRRLSDLESDRRNAAFQMESCKKEKGVLIKKIEILEADKRRTDNAIRETALQREAIEKSLNAMERENKELYKNCAQLQQQIAQLEIENGNRILDLTNKQRSEQERQLHRMKQEKNQIEKVIENRERTHRNRIKQLEDQVIIMRDQLEAERRRRREYVDRTLVGDIGRLGGNVLGIRSYDSAGIDHYGGGVPGGARSVRFAPRTMFASNPLTPPIGSSTPTHRAFGGELPYRGGGPAAFGHAGSGSTNINIDLGGTPAAVDVSGGRPHSSQQADPYAAGVVGYGARDSIASASEGGKDGSIVDVPASGVRELNYDQQSETSSMNGNRQESAKHQELDVDNE